MGGEIKTEEEYQRLFETCSRTLHQRDPTAFLAQGFNALFTYHIPSIVAQYGITTVLFKGLKYTFSITDVCVMNASANISDCFDFFHSKSVPVTAKLTLDVVPLLAVDMKPTVLCSLRTVIIHLPIPTGRTLLYAPAFDDPDVRDEFMPSGSFVNHGKPRSLPPIKTMRNNTKLIYDKTGFWKLVCRSAHHGKKYRSTSSIEFIIWKHTKKMLAICCKLPFSKQQQIHVGILALAFGCPPREFIALLKAMMGDKYDAVVFRPYEISFLYDPTILANTTQDAATLVISRMFGKDMLSTGVNQLKTEVFPHINIQYENDVEGLHRAKLLFLAKCVSLIILAAAGKIEDTNRDLFTYSSITTPADSVGTLFRLLFIMHIKTRGKLMRRMLMQMIKKPPECQEHINLEKLYGQIKITAQMMSAMASGTFSAKKKGVTIPLNTNNYEGWIGQLLRISSSLSTTDSTHTDARHVQFDGFRYVCPSKSPDGELVGLVTALAQFATITPDCPYPLHLTLLLEKILSRYLISISEVIGKDLMDLRKSSQHVQQHQNNNFSHFEGPTTSDFLQKWKDSYFMYFNNCGIPTHFVEASNIDLLIELFVRSRRMSMFTPFAFLQKLQERREIHVICEGGQIASPLVVVENLHLAKPSMSFDEMLLCGIVEYVNPAEETTILMGKVAPSFVSYMNMKDTKCLTHIELTQTTCVCREVASVPFCTSFQAPRASYRTQQVKQIITADPKKPYGSILTTQLWYSFRSLVTTISAQYTPTLCTGQGYPAVIAFMAHLNQEDAFAICDASIQRGFSAASTTRIYTSDVANPTKMFREQFEKCSEEVISRKNLNDNAIQENGFCKEGTFVPAGAIIMSKTRTEKTSSTPSSASSSLSISSLSNSISSTTKAIASISARTMCISTTTRHDEQGILTNNTHVKTPFGERHSSSITTARPMELGDKGSTYHSQKGVLGYRIPQKDMMFSLSTGCTVDLLGSPLSIISRMTMASGLEALTGKAVSLSGNLSLGIDKQRFEESTDSIILANEQILKAYGFNPCGTETFIDGITGKIITGQVFTGIVEYARLIQMAGKKVHARDGGKRERLTRQPCEGRRFGGGLRCGPMEAAAIGAHGASKILQAAYKQQSDNFNMFICSRCKMAADGNEGICFSWCRSCQSREKIMLVSIPFTLLVTITELMAMGIVVYIHTRLKNKIVV